MAGAAVQGALVPLYIIMRTSKKVYTYKSPVAKLCRLENRVIDHTCIRRWTVSGQPSLLFDVFPIRVGGGKGATPGYQAIQGRKDQCQGAD